MPGDARDLVIVKVGGSLYGEPKLGRRLSEWLKTQSDHWVLLVPGGGEFANFVRVLDAVHRLGEEASHWLAVSALGVAAQFLTTLLPRTALVDSLTQCPNHWDNGRVPILDPYRFAKADEEQPDHLPHHWSVTSDALAARMAVVARATRLVLLKSVNIPPGMDWSDAARQGIVDPVFSSVVTPGLDVQCINFRQWRI